ncbi:GntR family transcriptional regulator [Salinivibrio sp. ES.052]|uniref:GntR family transcriptional regulator n=1 Tax=Salinivibrio sp. ES.052 TaxID=1882823 RepID=UPI0009293BA9|nr:GntR family transcriptional regulator [Salinivibrio sp. ES.052]SIO20054.1 transcriptional regulator, GntR family [Salinivibrio sp. ES.052]
MRLSLDSKDATPKFQQLIEQIQRHIASGTLYPGARLPSVRQLARELGMNPMTVSRSYQQLAEEGWLERVRGIGMQVSATIRPAEPEQRLQYVEGALAHFVQATSEAGYSKSEAMALVMTYWEAYSDDQALE